MKKTFWIFALMLLFPFCMQAQVVVDNPEETDEDDVDWSMKTKRTMRISTMPITSTTRKMLTMRKTSTMKKMTSSAMKTSW